MMFAPTCFDLGDHDSPEYRRGVDQLMRWKEHCRRKRLGIDAAEKAMRRKEEHEHKRDYRATKKTDANAKGKK